MLQSTVWTRRLFFLSLVALGGVCSSAVHAQVASNEFPPTVRTESNMQWKVSGKVTGPIGIPIPNAKVYLSRGCVYGPITHRFKDFSEPVAIGLSGEYEIDVRENYRLLFVAPGFAPLNLAVPDGSSLDASLELGRTVSGTILLPSGEPVIGAIVAPVQWLIPKPNASEIKIDPTQAKYDRGLTKNISAGLPDFGKDQAAVTDSDGHFSIARVPSDFHVGLSVKAPGIKEVIVYVRSEDDAGNLDFESQILEENEFTYKSTISAVLEVSAIEAATGQPASIANIHIQPIIGGGGAEHLRFSESFNGPSATMNMLAYPNGSTAMVVPQDDAKLMGSQFQLPPNQEREVIERKVEFERGRPIRGKVVSAKTGDPIAGVRVRWRSFPEMKEVDEKGNFPRFDIESNRDGEFAMSVPDVDGLIGVIGLVPGFSCITNWNERELYEKFSPGLIDEFTIALQAGDQENADIEFRLRPCFRLEIDVIRDGLPVPNCILKGERRNYSDWSSNKRMASSFSVLTDENGHAVVDQWYDNPFFVEKARYEATLNSTELQQPQFRYSSNHYPSIIQAFTDDGFGQAVVTIPLPDRDPPSYVIPVTINLQDPPSLLGRIVDTDGNGIAGLEIAAFLGGSYFSASQTWKTSTNKDGWFKMQGLSFGNFRWKIDERRVKTKEGGGAVTIDTSGLENGKILESPSIVCLDMTALAEELPELDLDRLSNEEALVALSQYVRDNITRIPEGPREFLSSSSGGDAMHVFLDRVNKKAQVEVEKLADRSPGSDFELRLLTAAPAFFYTRNMFAAPTRGNGIDQFCAQRLIKNHISNANSQPLLIQAVANTTHSYQYFDGEHKEWQKLFESSPFNQTRAVAANELLVVQSQAMRELCKQYQNQKSFDQGLAQLKKYLNSAKENADLIPPKFKERALPWLENSLKNVEQAIKPRLPNSQPQPSYSFNGADSTNRLIKSRAQAVYDLLHPYVESLRD